MLTARHMAGKRAKLEEIAKIAGIAKITNIEITRAGIHGALAKCQASPTQKLIANG